MSLLINMSTGRRKIEMIPCRKPINITTIEIHCLSQLGPKVVGGEKIVN